MHQSADLVGKLANRRNLVDWTIELYGAARHFLEGGFAKALNQSLAASLFQGDKSLGAVLQKAG